MPKKLPIFYSALLLTGVNLLLRENLIPVGVIGVSGDPSTVMSLAKLIKLSFESLYDYELQRE